MASTVVSASRLVLAGCLVSLIPALATAEWRSAPAATDARAAGMQFDIPSQPLQSALDAYNAATGFSGLYGTASLIGRHSVAVHGRYTPDAALRQLIGQNGLVIQYTAADAFILEPGAAESAAATLPADTAYAGVLQSHMRDAFCRDRRIAPGNYRIAVSFHINTQGRIQQPQLLSSTGDRPRDTAILDALRELDVGRSPADPSQPYVMLILPQSQASSPDCRGN